MTEDQRFSHLDMNCKSLEKCKLSIKTIVFNNRTNYFFSIKICSNILRYYCTFDIVFRQNKI